MTPIRIEGVEAAIRSLSFLPRRVAFKHLRVALNAAGGSIRNAAKSYAPKETGALKASLRVKVKIPDASWSVEHHGKPAYIVVGPARGYERAVALKRGKLRTLTKKRAAIADKAKRRRPSRYAHIAERHQSYIRKAERGAGKMAAERLSGKLRQAIETEAAWLYGMSRRIRIGK